jgi:hypothetical protein
MNGRKTYHQLAVEYPTNAGFRMMADRERLMMDDDSHHTLARLRELRELLRLGACTERDAAAAAGIIASHPETFEHMGTTDAVDLALELARAHIESITR